MRDIWIYVVAAAYIWRKIVLFQRELEQKCIQIGITELLEIVNWGGKLSVLWSQIVFYGSADVLR